MPGDKSLSKLRTVCRYGVWIVDMAMIILAVVAISCILGMMFCIFDSSFILEPFDREASVIAIADYIVMSVFGIVVCLLTHRIVTSIRDGDSPFIHENTQRMKRISGISILTFGAEILMQLVMNVILDPEIWQMNIPFSLLICTAITYVFALLFEYGTALQTESDDFL